MQVRTRNVIYFILIIILLTIAIAAFFKVRQSDEWTYRNPETYGCVPDSKTAFKIAEAVWQPIYGRQIESYRPFTAELKDSVWYVSGDKGSDFGGIIHIQISKNDCRVIRVYHEK